MFGMFNQMDIHPAVEKIAYQSTSKAGQRLEKLFEECYKIKDKLYKEKDSVERKKVCEAIRPVIEKGMKKILLDEFNLDVVKFSTNTGYPIGFISIDSYPIDYESMLDINTAITGDGSTSHSEVKKAIERMEKLMDGKFEFDRLQGKLKKTTWPILLQLDLQLMFFTSDFVDSDKKDLLALNGADNTPRELAAVYLHECGHAIMNIEFMCYQFYINKTMEKDVNLITDKKTDLVDKTEFLTKVVSPALDKALTNSNIDNKTKSLLTKLRPILNRVITISEFAISKREGVSSKFTSKFQDNETVKALIDASGRDLGKLGEDIPDYEDMIEDSSLMWNIPWLVKIITELNTVISKLCFLIIAPLILITVPLTAIVLGNIAIPAFGFGLIILALGKGTVGLLMDGFLSALNTATTNATSGMNKNKDIKGSYRNLYYSERYADEFVARHGYGADIASALYKMNILFITGSEKDSVNRSKILTMIANLYKWIDKASGIPIQECHDSDLNRARNVCQEMIGIFRNHDLDGKVRDYYITQVQRALHVLDVYKEQYFNIQPNKLIEVLHKITNPWSIISSIFTGKISEEYRRHYNELDDLTKSFLNYQGARLQQLADKMK